MDTTRTNGGWLNASIMSNEKTSPTSPFAMTNKNSTNKRSTGNFGKPDNKGT